MASKGQTRATAAPILVILAITAGLYGLIALNGWDYKPKLGLDLQGGTSVILGPKAINGADVNSDSINKAVDIIRRRVDGFGVAEAEVVREGDNILVAIPGGDSEQVAAASKTAQLRFRLVLDVAPGSAQPAPAPSASVSLAPSGSGSPSASASPSGSVAASASAPSSSASSGSASGSPSPTASPSGNGRALTAGLVRQSSESASASSAPALPGSSAPASPAAAPSGSSAPSASGLPSASALPSAPEPSFDPNAQPDPAQQQQLPTGPGAEEALAAYTTLDCLSSEPAAVVAQKKAAETDADPLKTVAICSEDGTEKLLLGPAVMTGEDVKGAEATIPENQWIVTLQLTGNGRRTFTKLTTDNVNKQFAIVLDGRVVSHPVINEAIPGDATISGSFNKKDSNDLANVLKYGALPLSFERLDLQTTPPSLGDDSLRAGVLAGLIGLGAVLLYIIAYYRGLGLVTVVGLGLWSALNFALIVILGQTIGFTLTLAGIAGFIISAGITSDSYIVYFERLKDEAREGRSIQSSADRGYSRAFKTIVAADTVSFLAAVILYRFSSGSVRGFAFTLGLSTLLDLLLSYMYTRPVVAALSRTKLFTTGRFVGIKGSVPVAARTGRTRQTKEA